ncbi:hypothetical protein C8R47DRAFT_1157376 [Mycena vitilis]|nr:hypothetical protein C8R47DRAFT_1157376 [Mycena vitilis]
MFSPCSASSASASSPSSPSSASSSASSAHDHNYLIFSPGTPCSTWLHLIPYSSGITSSEKLDEVPTDIPVPVVAFEVNRRKIFRHLAVEPLAVVVTYRPDQRQTSGYSEFMSLPRTFVEQGVRSLCLHGIDSPRMILDACPNVIDLTLTYAQPAFFPFLEVLVLQRLATNAHDLLDEFRDEQLTHPAFAKITHLVLFDRVSKSSWAEWADLAQLPALTHLCLGGEISQSLLDGVLEHCPRLLLFLNQWQALDEIQPADYCATTGVTDDRFVMIQTHEWVYEWSLTTLGCVDMWDHAAAFVAQKRDGLIDGSLFWLNPNPDTSSDGDSDDTSSVEDASHSDSDSISEDDSASVDTLSDNDCPSFEDPFLDIESLPPLSAAEAKDLAEYAELALIALRE